MSSIARPLTRGPSLWVPVVSIALALAAFVGAALWSRAEANAGEGAARSATARALAAEEAVADLQRELNGVESRLDDLTADRKQLSGRLERVSTALWDSLRRLRGDVAAAADGSKSALARVEDAAADAEGAARQLSVLEDRFEYHLRQDHGGG